MISLQRILAVVRKELIQLRRDRLTFGMIVGIPAAQLLLFGYAINMDPRNLDAAVADLSASAASREIVMDLSRSQVVNLRYQVGSAAELEALLRHIRPTGVVLAAPLSNMPRIVDAIQANSP